MNHIENFPRQIETLTVRSVICFDSGGKKKKRKNTWSHEQIPEWVGVVMVRVKKSGLVGTCSSTNLSYISSLLKICMGKARICFSL